MKIEKRQVKDKVLQITTSDERWYLNEETGIYRPSVTWIASFYPKGVGFYKWLSEHGWDESEVIKREAGERGSKVHQAIDILIKGGEVKIDDKFINNTTGVAEELTPEEYYCVVTFKEWVDEVKPKFIANEYIIEKDQCDDDAEDDLNKGYAGTVDIKCEIDGQLWIVDIKTSANIWDSHIVQINMYKDADEDREKLKIAILQVGYTKNKTKQYKFTEVEDVPEIVRSCRAIWKREAGKIVPKQKDYPLSLKLN